VYVLDAAATSFARQLYGSLATWRTLAPMVEGQEGNGPVLGSDDRIYFPGGYRNGVTVNFVQAYDPATDRWTEVAPTSQPRGYSGVVTLRDGRIAVLGGYGMGGTILSNVELYDPSTNRWSAEASLPGALTAMGVVLASDDLVHVVGGYNGTSNVATHYAFDPVSGSVRILAPLPVGRSHFRLVEAPTGTLLAIGGRQTTTAGPTQVATVSAYSLAANAWR
jgi:N-acetylneuraminic acid mutarotase